MEKNKAIKRYNQVTRREAKPPMPMRHRVAAGALATAAIIGGANALQGCSDKPGNAVEQQISKEIADGKAVDTANFGIVLGEGVNVRTTPGRSRAVDSIVSDENVAFVTKERTLILGAILMTDDRGRDWYGFSKPDATEIAGSEDAIADNMVWVSGDVVGQHDENGRTLGEIIYPEDAKNLDKAVQKTNPNPQVWPLNGRDPKEFVESYYDGSTVSTPATNYDIPNGAGS